MPIFGTKAQVDGEFSTFENGILCPEVVQAERRAARMKAEVYGTSTKKLLLVVEDAHGKVLYTHVYDNADVVGKDDRPQLGYDIVSLMYLDDLREIQSWEENEGPDVDALKRELYGRDIDPDMTLNVRPTAWWGMGND